MTSGPDQFLTGAGRTVSGVVTEHVDDSGNAVGDTNANPHPVVAIQKTITITKTVVSVTSTDGIILPANAARQSLIIINIGLGLVTIEIGATAVVGQGLPLTAALAIGDQGGGYSSDPGLITTQAIHAVSAAGSTVVVLEGA